MPEHSDHTTAVDFLESSALTARLLRRLSASPGVIDIQDILRTYARLAEWSSHARLLLDDLLARYSIDDGSAVSNLPLVTEQPWMLNLNTYLTNRNSFLSTTSNTYLATTNEFVSQRLSSSAAASQFMPPASSSVASPPGPAIGHSFKPALSHEVKTTQLESVSSSQASEKFRVSRKPGRVTTEITAAVARDVQGNPVSQPAQALTYHAGSTARRGKEDDTIAKPGDVAIARAENTASTIASSADLQFVFRPPAPSPGQRELPDEARNTSPVVSKDRASSDRAQATIHEGPVLPGMDSAGVISSLKRPTEITNLTLNRDATVRRLPDRLQALLERQIASRHSQTRPPDNLARGPEDSRTVGAPFGNQTAAVTEAGAQWKPGQPGQRQTDLVWRRNGIDRTVRELMSAVSDSSSLQAQRAAGGVSTAQSPPNSQTVTPESMKRKDQRQDGVEITAERILRRISNTLLVERDRRGY